MEKNDLIKPNFVTHGNSLVSCDIDPTNCLVRKLRENPYNLHDNFMCQHNDAPKLSSDLEKLMIYRTCVTKK